MNKTEALRLADELEAPVGTQSTYSAMQQAAAELRRLHAENEYIRSALKGWIKENRHGGWIGDLRAQRDALLEALRKMKNVAAGYSNYCDDSGTTRRLEREFEEADSIARAAIAYQWRKPNDTTT